MATIKYHVTNQAPVDFTQFQPIINDIQTDFSTAITNAIEPMIQALFKPLQPNQPTQMVLENQPYDRDQLNADLVKYLSSTNDLNDLNNQLSVIFHQASQYKTSEIRSFKNIIAHSFLLKNQAPLPNNTDSYYTYDTDIQVQAKNYLTNLNSPKALTNLLIGLYGVLSSRPVSDRWQFILIKDPNNYQQFQQTLQQLTSHDPKLLNQTQTALQIPLDDIDSLTSLTAGIDNEAHSFNRYIIKALKQTNLTPLPVDLHALLNPVGFSFINLTTLANTDAHHFNHELNQLSELTNQLVKFKITKLSTIKSAKQLSQQQHQLQRNYQKRDPRLSTTQRQTRGFQKTLPTVNQQIARLTKIVKQFTSNMQSDNSYRQSYTTFMRPNRRYPDDPNLRGQIQTIKYRPDIHIYLDCSGSISEDQYKASIMMLILIAKKLKTNLYFTSFSHEIAQPVKLITKNASPSLIYREIKAVPKVGGGTEYENVWNMIDAINRQSQAFHQAPRLNFMITDFAYDLNSGWTPRIHQPSTTSLYYMPMAANQNDYQTVREWAKTFADELLDHGDTKIYSRILM